MASKAMKLPTNGAATTGQNQNPAAGVGSAIIAAALNACF
jgi:hypothetical protein